MRFLLYEKMVYIFFGIFLLGILIFFHFRGITYYDEGYILNAALKVAHGQVPFRDFEMVYTPISYLFTAMGFKIFGESILAGRIVALIVSICSLYGLFSLLQLITKNKLLIVLSLLFFVAWGPSHINFPWPTPFAVCFFIYTLLFYFQGILNKQPKYFYFAGIFCVMIFLSKQNFGVGVILVSILFLLLPTIHNFFVIPAFAGIYKARRWIPGLYPKGISFPEAALPGMIASNKASQVEKKYQIKNLSHYLYGVLSTCVLVSVILFFTSSFIPFLQNMYVNTVQKIIFERSLDTPFLYEGTWGIKIIKLLFYLSPLIISLIAAINIDKKNKKLLIIPLFTGVFYLSGIRPVTDYNHVVFLIALSCLPLAVCIDAFKKQMLRQLICFGFLLLFILLGFYSAYFKGYYKWETPLSAQTIFVENPRVNIFVSPEEKMKITQLVSYIDNHTLPGDYIFVNYYAPMIYFLSDRRNAAKYDYVNVPLSYQLETVKKLETENVKLVITTEIGKNPKAIIDKYIVKNYYVDRQIGGYIFYLRNMEKL